MTDTLLPGDTALVTGAANGIGRAIAQALVAEGVRVVLADLNAAQGDATAAALRAAGHDARFIPADLGAPDGAAALAAAVVEAVHAVAAGAERVLVAAAGQGRFAVAAVQGDLARRQLQRPGDKPLGDAHPSAVHPGARAPQELEGLGLIDDEPGPLEHPQRGFVQALALVVVES